MVKYIFWAFFLFFSGVSSAAANDSFSVTSGNDFVHGSPSGACNSGDIGVDASGVVFSCKQKAWVKPQGSLEQGAACGFGSTKYGETSVRCNGYSVNSGCPDGYVSGSYTDNYDNRRYATLKSCYKR